MLLNGSRALDFTSLTQKVTCEKWKRQVRSSFGNVSNWMSSSSKIWQTHLTSYFSRVEPLVPLSKGLLQQVNSIMLLWCYASGLTRTMYFSSKRRITRTYRFEASNSWKKISDRFTSRLLWGRSAGSVPTNPSKYSNPSLTRSSTASIIGACGISSRRGRRGRPWQLMSLHQRKGWCKKGAAFSAVSLS